MRLQGWKEISGYLKCGIRTAQRWEKQGLPVRQLGKGRRSPVFAFSEELDEWVKRGGLRQLSPNGNSELVQHSAQLRAQIRESREHLKAQLQTLWEGITTLRNIKDRKGSRVSDKSGRATK
jgi:hypothetical protein